jgi:hypothetical protein
MRKKLLLFIGVIVGVFLSLSVFGQGTETFSNIPAPNSSSSTRTWTGDDGSTWTATNARTDQTITGSAITLNDDSTPCDIISGTITGGVGNISVSTKMPFSDAGTEPPSLYINTTFVGTLPYGSSATTTTFSNVNISGDFVIKIDNDGGEGRITFDDITWTAYSAVSCSGEPTAQATGVTASNATATTLDVSWTAGTGGDNYMLVAREASSVSWTPTDGTDYSAQTGSGDFSSATDQASGNKVVYVGSGTSTTVTGLSASTTYYFQVFHLCSSDSDNYLTSTGANNDGTQNGTTTAVSTSKKILFDGTSGQSDASADWVVDADSWDLDWYSSGTCHTTGTESNPQRYPTPAAPTAESDWDGGNSEWAYELYLLGYTIESLGGCQDITYGDAGNPQDLSNYDVFICNEPNVQFTASEKTAIIAFVNAGGGLYMGADHGDTSVEVCGTNTEADRNCDGWNSTEIWNDLMSGDPFGIQFDNINTNSPTSSNIISDATDPILHNNAGDVSSISFNDGATMTINTSNNASAKGVVFMTGTSLPATTNAMVSYASYGAGRVVGVGDSSPTGDATGDTNGETRFNNWSVNDNGTIIMNATIWLLGPTGPEINVKGNSVNIVDGDIAPSVTDDTDFGAVLASSGTIAKTFTIQNIGGADLTISNATVSAGDFTITSAPSGTVAASGSTTIVITYDPSAVGTTTETVTITSDDVDEGTYTFDITGEGLAPDITAPLVTALSPLDNATDVAINADLVLTFDETVQAGTGNIVIKEVSGGSTFQTIAIGSTTISGSTVTVSHNDFANSTEYYVEIASGVITDEATTPNNYAGISGSSAWNYTTASLTYCDPAPSSDDGSGITNVTLGTINNTSADPGPPYYEDYSAQSTDVVQGATVNCDIEYSTGYTYLTKIWVDWNNDGDFDDIGEVVHSGECLTTSIPTTYSANFTIPVAASLGIHRLRIGGADSGTLIPCYTGTWATYEDYSINVIAAGPTITLSTATLAGFSYEEASGPSGEQSFTVTGTNLTTDITVTPSTNYEISLTSGGTFVTTPLVVTQSSGDASDIIYVRLKTGLAINTYNGEVITLTSTGATNKTVTCSGNVTAVDNTAPTVSTFSPADNATDVAIDTDLVLTFNETVQAGTGNILIKLVSDNSTVQTIDVTSGSVSISGTDVTINPSDLSYSTAYYVEIASGVITDEATTPNNYAGISGSSAWNFTTEAVPAAANLVITEVSPKGFEGDFNDEFIEISNLGGSSVDLTNWTIEYYQDGSLAYTGDLTGSIAANDGYIITFRSSTGLASDFELTGFMSGSNCYVILKESGVIKDEAGTSGDVFSSSTNYELTDCGADNSIIANWDDIGSGAGVGTPGVVNCVVTEQEINIQESATNVLDGTTYDFGDVENGSSSSVITFTIQNTGTLDLTLSGTPKIVKSGTNPGDYTIVETSTTSPVTGGGTTTFTIQFTPAALGARTAAISIANNDTDENPYIINLTGNCTAPDVTAPTATLSPVDNAITVDNTTNLVLTFDENIDAGTGNIVIYRTSDDGLVESFDITTDVSISGAVVTINPSSDLSYSTEYYVLIDNTAIVDEATTPNNYAGISSTTAWSFTTMDMPAVPEAMTPCREALDGYPDWTDTDATGTTTIYMIDGTSSLISPAMNFNLHTGETISLDADKYGGATDAEAVITVSVSEDNGSTWSAAGTFNPTTTSLDPQTPIDLSSYSGTQVKVKLETLAANNSDGVIVDNICIMGSVICSTPTVQANNISFSNISAYSMQIDWTNGDGLKRAVFMKDGAGAITNPTTGVTYTASSDWSSKGTQLGTSGYYCVYNGSASTVTLTNLAENTEYYVQVIEYGCSVGAQQYYTATATNNPNNELTLVANPTLVVTPASLTSLDYNAGSGPSVAQSFDISGTDLTAGPITITAPANFLVCSTEGGTYVSSYTIPYTAPTLASTTVYVKLAASLSDGSYSGNITCSGGSATTQNVAVEGDVLPVPLITITGSDITLNSICNIEGEYSTVQTFDVDGSNLTADLTVGFSFTSSKIELSSDNTNWYSATTATLTFTPVANTVNETIYVRSVGGVGTTTGSTATAECKSTSATTKTIDIDYIINDLPFIGSPSDLTVAEGDPATFSIFDPTGLTFQWQQSEPFPSTTWIDLIGETSNSLTLPSVSAEMDQYEYRIYATNANGCTETSSFSGVLTVTSTGLINSCGTQTFDSGTTPPSGWTFTNINSTSGSALEMDATNDRIMSAEVTAPSVMSFWLQGLGTMTGSSLIVEGFNGFSWNTIENITSIPTSATTKTYTVAGNSIDNYSKFRFTFTKGASSANLAFDDVNITCGTEDADAWILDESFDNVTSVADINNDLTDVPGFTAAAAGGATLEAASIVCKYNRNPGSLKFDGTDGGTITITTPLLTIAPDLLTFYTAGVGNGDLEVQTSTTAKASFTTIHTLSTIVGPGTIHFVNLDTDVVKVRFVFTQGSSGYAYFDDIRIRDDSKGGNSGNDIKILQTLIETCNLGSEGEDEFVLFKTGSRDIAVRDLSVSFPGGGIGGNEHSMDATNQFISNPSWISDVNDIVELTNPGCRPVKEPIAGVIPANSYAIVFTGNSPEKYDFKEICPSTSYYAIFSNNTNGTGKYSNTPTAGVNYYTSIIDKSTGSYDTQFYNDGKTCLSGCTAYYDEASRNLTYDANGCNMTLLPIELLSFTADCDYGNINLKWVTTSETNNDYFTIEKSYDMKNWDIVSVISGAGNSTTSIDYTYIDSYESIENVYYRLKQTDYNGAFSYSAAISANCFSEQNIKLLLYPNPTNSELKCEFYSPFRDNYIVEIINTYGQTVLQKSYELHEDLNFIDFDLSNFSEGVYYFKIYSLNGEVNEIKKIIKQ